MTVDSSANSLQNLTVGHNQFAVSALQGNGTLNIDVGGELTANQDLTLGLDGTTSTLLVRGDLTVAGTLSVASGGNGTITLQGGKLKTNNFDFTNGTFDFESGILEADGIVQGNVVVPSDGLVRGTGNIFDLTVGDGATVSPGHSPGSLLTNNTEWGSGGNYLWEINRLLSGGGSYATDPGWNSWAIGNLTVTATPSNPFNILLNSLTSGNVAGTLANWDASQADSWWIAQSEFGTFTPSVLSSLAIDASAFSSFNNLSGGSFEP